MSDGVRITRAGLERVDELEPLWLSMHEHHRTLDLETQLRESSETWPLRRALYQKWLVEPDAFVMIAEDEGSAIGYALVVLHDPDEQRATGPRFGVLESLAVEPDRRSEGLGRALMQAVYAELRRLGVIELEIGVIFANEAARRFYEREGFRPWAVEYFGPLPDA